VVRPACRRGRDLGAVVRGKPQQADGAEQLPRLLGREVGLADVRAVRAVAGATGLPIYPIGGITPANAAGLVEAGATRLAVGAGICAAPDPGAAARALRALLPGA